MVGATVATGIDVGTLIADTYKVTRLLGRGGMGQVWEAEHLRLPGKRVAIKVLHADISHDPDSVARFRREAEIASRLGHPHIVGVHDFNTLPSGKPYLVLDYLEGDSLDARMQAGPMAVEETLEIAVQVASALRAAHREQVIHRDLKPQNVFLARSPDGSEVAKVLDFGISKIRGSTTVKTHGSVILGTPQYMAPEQAVGNHDAVDATTDVFALGVMIYEMLSGRPPFVGQTIPEVVFKIVYEEPVPLAQVMPNLPENVTAGIHKALAKKQSERFASVEAFVEALTGRTLTTARRRRASMQPDPGRIAGAAAAGAPAGDGRLGLADTIDSAKLETQLAAQQAQAEQAPATEKEAPGTERVDPTAIAASGSSKRRLGGLAIALALIGALAAVAIVGWQAGWFGGTQQRASAPAAESSAAPHTATAAMDTAAAPDPASAAPPTSRAPAPPDSSAEPATPAATRADRVPPAATMKVDGSKRSREAEKREEEPGKTHPDLVAAQRALDEGDASTAIRLSTRALRDGAGPRANAIKAMAYCVRLDIGNARANYLNLSAGARRSVARFCKKHGMELE